MAQSLPTLESSLGSVPSSAVCACAHGLASFSASFSASPPPLEAHKEIQVSWLPAFLFLSYGPPEGWQEREVAARNCSRLRREACQGAGTRLGVWGLV